MKPYAKIFIVSLILSGCSLEGEQQINFGEDQCVYCRMTISNPKYGALLVTDKGRIRKYDAAECMINDQNEKKIESQKMMVIPIDQPEKLIPADSAFFVISNAYRSPMGANLAAFTTKKSIPDSLSVLEWSQVVNEIAVN